MKKVLCMLLCLCMMISILPTALVINAEAASKEMTFNYGYDVQRNPAFPAKAGDKVTLSGFQTPLRYGSTAYGSMRRYENSKGTWTLTEVGTYGSIGSISPAPTAFLKSIVKTVAENCGISDMNSIVIHKLTGNNNNLVGYGVVLCVDEDAGQALFLVDLFNDSGAGMLLSKTEVTSKSVTITADKIAQSGTGAKENESTSIPSDAKMVETLNFTMTEPYAWEKPAKTATVKQSNQVEVVDVKWNGAMWNADGTFMQGASYSVDITIRLKSGVNMYFDKKAYNFTINDAHGIGFAEISNDKRQAVIRKDYTFLKSKDEEALYEKEEQERLEERENNRKGTPVDKLEPGDSGSFKFTGSVYFLDYPKDYTDPKIGSSTAIAGHWDEIEVVEAYIPSLNRENQFYHAVRAVDGGEVKYVLVKEDKFSSYRKTGSNPDRPYAKKWASQIKIGDPIEKINTYLLEFPNGIPTYSFTGSDEVNFTVEKVEYEHPNGVEPFMFTTAVVTYKAKDGYYFDEKLTKLNEYRNQAEHTTGFKIIDDKTMEVYLTAFTWDMGYDVRVSDEMLAFREKVSNMHLLPIATAELNFPLYEHWNMKILTNDYEFNDHYAAYFLEKNMRSIYKFPTSAEYAHKGDKTLIGMDPEKDTYPRSYTFIDIQIADDDLSDDIPGLVGKWCLLTDGRYIPRSCLKNFEYETMFKGAPAEFIDTPFEFAGGSGTLEDPFLIENANQLNAVRKGPKHHYKLIADIDLSGWGNWVPIGGTPAYGFLGNGKASDYAYSFQGSFDGNGHVISGMQIIINEETPFMTAMTGNYRAYGLFASMATNPVEYKIKNLGVVDFTIDVTYTNVEKQLDIYAAAIVGGMNAGTDIYNCYSKGGKINFNITAKSGYSPAANFRVGGICADGGGVFGGYGNPRPGASWMHIEKCFNDSDINITLNGMEGYAYAGGIIASIDTTHIHECYNSGNITLPVNEGDYEGSWHESVAAGIAAFASIPEIPNVYHKPPEAASFIQNCYNSGNITARGAAGIFMQSSSDIHFENCYNVGTIAGNKLDESTGYPTSSATVSPMAAVTQYGTEFIRNCYSNGTSVSGAAWKISSALGRKVLVSHPEDNPPSTAYNFKPTPVGKFTDVHVGDWYATPVSWAVRAKITSGTSATTFSPDNTCTRAQILTFMWRADGSPKMNGENPFTDVTKSDYFYDAALWAYENDMVSGSTFAGNTPCTRADTVVYLWKRDGSPKANQYQGNFTDVSASDSFATAVAWALRYNITSGTSATTFSPWDTCTRGQIVTFLRRAY